MYGGKKLVVIGDTAVGKTHLCVSLMDSSLWKFDDEYPSYDLDEFNIHRGIRKSPSVGTINFHYEDFKDDGKRYRFQIFDRAAEYMPCPQEHDNLFYEDVSGALLVYDMMNSKSFDHLGAWLEVLKRETSGSKLAITIVGNKSDLANSGSVPTTSGQSFANEHGCLFFETSALQRKNVQKAFESIFKGIISMPSDLGEEFNPHAIRAAQNQAAKERAAQARALADGDDVIRLQNKKKSCCIKPCCCGT